MEAGVLRKRIEPHKRKENGVDVAVVTIVRFLFP